MCFNSKRFTIDFCLKTWHDYDFFFLLEHEGIFHLHAAIPAGMERGWETSALTFSLDVTHKSVLNVALFSKCMNENEMYLVSFEYIFSRNTYLRC